MKSVIKRRILQEAIRGWKKTLFCLAVNLLPPGDLWAVFADGDLQLPVQDRTRMMEKRLKEKSSIELKLRRIRLHRIETPS